MGQRLPWSGVTPTHPQQDLVPTPREGLSPGLSLPTPQPASLGTWHQDVSKAQEGEGPVAQGQGRGVEPGHLQDHGQLRESRVDSLQTGPAWPGGALHPTPSDSGLRPHRDMTHLLMGGGVRGSGGHLHHDAVPALHRRVTSGWVLGSGVGTARRAGQAPTLVRKGVMKTKKTS